MVEFLPPCAHLHLVHFSFERNFFLFSMLNAFKLVKVINQFNREEKMQSKFPIIAMQCGVRCCQTELMSTNFFNFQL